MAYSESQISPDFKTAFVNYVILIVFVTALLNPISGYFLHRFILPKPGEGPSMKKMEKVNFTAIYAQGKGTKGTVVESMIYFPKDCGYYETARMVVECGLSMALEEDKLAYRRKAYWRILYSCLWSWQCLVESIDRNGNLL